MIEMKRGQPRVFLLGLFWTMTVSAKVWIDWSPEYRGRVGNDLGTDREKGTGETNKDLREID